MVAMRVMQMALDPVIDMIAVRHRLMAAAGAMNMPCRVTGAAMVQGAAVGVVAGHLDHVLVDMVRMRVVQVAVMQIVDMAAVPDRGVAAAGTMLVSVLGMLFVGAGGHRSSSFTCPRAAGIAARPSAA
jgi:hypothetical protein